MKKLMLAYGIGFAICIQSSIGETEYPKDIEALFEQHCYDCHDEDTSKGGLNLVSLGVNLDDSKTFKSWVRVLERVREGEMPP